MKCKHCGKEVDDRTVFCPYCQKNTFTPTEEKNVKQEISTENTNFETTMMNQISGNKVKNFIKNNKPALIAISLVVIAIITMIVIFILFNNLFSVVETIPTTTPPTENITTINFESYTIDNVSFNIPEDWKFTSTDDDIYTYRTENGALSVSYSSFNFNLDENSIKTLISETEDALNNPTQLKYDINKQTYGYQCSASFIKVVNDEVQYYDITICTQGCEYIYLIFSNNGSTLSEEFEQIKPDILKSIEFLQVNTVPPMKEEVTTEEPTESPTEKPTDPPTEKPTEITDGKALLYSDDAVDIYFDSISAEKYRNEDANIYFLVNNKTDKKLTFLFDTITLDGISYNKLNSYENVGANSKGSIEIGSENTPHKTPLSIGASLTYTNMDDFRNEITIPNTNL